MSFDGYLYKCYYTPYNRPEILLGSVDWHIEGLRAAMDLAHFALADMIAKMWYKDAKRVNPQTEATPQKFQHSARKYCYPEWRQVDENHWSGYCHDGGSIYVYGMVCLRIELVKEQANG